MDRLEQLPIDEIEAFFVERGYSLSVHTNPPTGRTEPSHWVDLAPEIRWYGSGESVDDAVRGAARRYRIEQIGTDEPRPDT